MAALQVAAHPRGLEAPLPPLHADELPALPPAGSGAVPGFGLRCRFRDRHIGPTS
jgi:hypothetical protein